MRILLDIGHPAHVHYFRNAVNQLTDMGHSFLITTRDKEVTIDLLKAYKLNYVCTGKNLTGKIKKFLSMFRNDVVIYREAKKFKPDVFLSFFTPFAAQVGRLMRKPVIGFMDSEFDKMRIKLTRPFTDYIFTPKCYWDNYGKNHFRFNGYMETFYLHPKYFTPDKAVLKKLGIEEGERFFILRFVAFNAGHDAGEKGIDDTSKIKIVEYLSTLGKVFISSEKQLPKQFEHLKFNIPPDQFHSVLSYAFMYVGEGITTASECAHVGTPAVLINTIKCGYIEEQEKLGMVHQFDSADKAFYKIKELANDVDSKKKYMEKSKLMLSRLADCTSFLVWLLENFPGSIERIKSDPGHIANFN